MNKTFTDFFGFSEDPFKRTPDVDFYFLSEPHKQALEMLNYLLVTDESFAVLTGGPGTGKSITVRKFIQELPSSVRFAYIYFPNLRPEEMFQAVLEDFGVSLEGNVSKNTLFTRFQDFLVASHREGRQVLLILDEAQNLPVETLEELRILSNLETDKEKLLKIVLAGQPALDTKLNSGNLCQLKQRITLSAKLRNLKRDELNEYINYRLRKASRNGVKISSGVAGLVWSYTKGNPRLVNTLMERAINAACMDGSKSIRKSHINSAVKSVNTLLEMGKASFITLRKAVAACVFIALFAGTAAAYYTLAGHNPVPKAPEFAEMEIDNLRQLAQVNPAAAPAPALPAPPEPSEPFVAEPGEPRPLGVPREPAEPSEPAAPVPRISREPAEPQPGTPPEPRIPTVREPGVFEPAVPEPVAPEPVAPEPQEPRPPEPRADEPVTVAALDSGTVATIPSSIHFGVNNTAIVTSSALNVRAEPAIDADRVGRLVLGQRVIVQEESTYWIKVSLPEGGQGWVHKRYLRPEGEEAIPGDANGYDMDLEVS